MHKYKSATVLCLLALSCACLAAGCGKKHREKIDLSEVQTAASPETMSPETEDNSSQPEKSTDGSSADYSENGQNSPGGASSSGAGASASRISARINTYTSGKVSIQYPSVVNLDSSDQTAAVDALLKKNALSILDAWNINDEEDGLTITCQVLSADRSRITAVYTGTAMAKDAAHPTNIFYSNTVNVRKASDMKFSDYAAPYTMAGYVRSDDCTFSNVSEELNAELMKAKNDVTLEQYTDLFQHADFPIKTGESGVGTSLCGAFGFPGSFSYEYEGTIFFSIPVSHALGDYAIVAYTPETK